MIGVENGIEKELKGAPLIDCLHHNAVNEMVCPMPWGQSRGRGWQFRFVTFIAPIVWRNSRETFVLR